MRHRVERETELIIELATKAGELRSLPARVVHITQERDGCWIAGCAFVSLLTQDELEDFLAEYSAKLHGHGADLDLSIVPHLNL